MEFRFNLIFPSGNIYVQPLQVSGFKIRSEAEADQIFFRSKAIGSLKFIKGQGFEILSGFEKSSGRCSEFFLEVEKNCEEKWLPYWKGTFSLNEGDWNYSKCEVTIPIRPNDAYRKIIDYWSKEFNILELAPTDVIAAKLDLNQEFEFIKLAAHEFLEDLDDPDTWALFLQYDYWVDGVGFNKGYRADDKFYFRTITTRPFENGIPAQVSGWTIIDDDPATQTATYARKPAIYNFKPYVYYSKASFNEYPELIQTECGAAFDAEKYVQVAECTSARKKVSEARNVQILWQFGSFVFGRNRRLLAVIDFLLGKIDPLNETRQLLDHALYSEFFTSDINYATGETNKVKNLLVAQKSDIISSRSTERATKGMLSLKDLLSDLRNMFQVYWFLDANGKFRIEHLSFFENVGELDFTTPQYMPHLEGKERYTYLTEKMPRFEVLTMPEAQSEDFQKGVIEYISPCVNYQEGQDKKEYPVTRINTDVETLIVIGDETNREGFVLLAHDGNGVLNAEAGAISGRVVPNGALAAANLVRDYWQHGRILIDGLVNNLPTEFKSVKKTKKQIAFAVPLCCSLEVNPFFTYITNVSENGSLLSSEADLFTGKITVEIVHEGSGSGLMPSRQFDDSFDFSYL